MTSTRQRTRRTLSESFAPRCRISVSEWAEKHVILPSGTTKRPGPISFSWCPYLIEPMNRYTDRGMRKTTLCFATRSGKTEALMCDLRYSVAEEREAILWGKPNQDDAEKDSEGRFRPTVESSPVLRALKPSNPHHYRKALMRFRTGPVYFVGAGSPAKTRNLQIGRLFLDEIDVMRRSSDRETGALENFYERIKDHPDPKIMLSSTPTVASAQVWKEFIKGDQRYYWVPCPHCGQFLRFVLKGVRWADTARQPDGTWNLSAVRESVHYVCPHCAAKITDRHKPDMLKAGQWRPTPEVERLAWEGKPIPHEDGHYSYHLNSIYPSWITFYQFAEKFLVSKPDHEAWQSFINQWLAEPYFDFGNRDEMKEALEKTKIEVAPNAPRIPAGHRPILHVDVQQLECWCRVRAFNERRDSVGLEFAMLSSLQDAEVLRRKWGCPFAGVDIGYHDRLQEVLEFIHRNRPHWIATWGSGTMFAPVRLAQVHIGGGVLKGVPVPCIKNNPTAWKEILTERIKGGKDGTPRWVNEAQLSPSYDAQMHGEVRKIRSKPGGAKIVEYVKISANHAYDCEVNLLAMFDVLRPVLWPGVIASTQSAAPPGPPPSVDDPDAPREFDDKEDYERFGRRVEREKDRDQVW